MSLDDPIVAAVLADLAPAVQPAPAIAGMPSRFACFVTGTDTEIGKTLTSSALLHALVARGVRACGRHERGKRHRGRNQSTHSEIHPKWTRARAPRAF